MAYLKTVLTYDRPSEAEVDKAFLESNGITVCLLNANTSRNELGTPFYIRLQVPDEELRRATHLLREMNPSRFGSQAKVDEIARDFQRSMGLFFLGAIPVAVIFYMITPAPIPPPYNAPLYQRRDPDLRPIISFFAGLLGGTLAGYLGRKRSSVATSAPATPDS